MSDRTRELECVIADLKQQVRDAEKERDALRAKIETAENDAAHQKALAASALRVAEGWERKCGELRAKIERIDEAMESLLIRCDDSDSAMYGTLSTSFVRDTVRIARGAMEESK